MGQFDCGARFFVKAASSASSIVAKSTTLFATGRAMRTAPGKEMGYVLLPLFLETEENETIEDALERTDFEEAWDVLQAMQEQDAVLAQIIREMREERGRRGGFDDSRLSERVQILGPEVALEVLRDAVNTVLVDQLGGTWDERYGELKRYMDQFGDCNVPKGWSENPRLASWVANQRTLELARKLSSQRKVRLETLGFVWKRHDSRWETMLDELMRYKQRHGHCNVPAACEENPQLGHWVATQRQLQSVGKLAPPREARLNELGFIWNPLDSTWETMFAEVKRYRERFGDCIVPKRWNENPTLGVWVSTQRGRHTEGQISAEQNARLDALGFVWDIKDLGWETKFSELKRYRDRFGDCNVPDEWGENPPLGKWVGNQRTRQKSGKLSPSRKARLDELGFLWEQKETAWETMFTELQRYSDEYGDCKVSARWVKNPQLASWVSRQRTYEHERRLSSARKARLDALGFVWDIKDLGWETKFSELKRYRTRFGDCNVPDEWGENPPLGKWVGNQRTRQKSGKLSPSRKARLDELGFEWARNRVQ